MVPVSELAFHQRLGRVMEHLGGDGFWPAMAAFLRHVAAFDSWVAMVFRPSQSPQVLYEGDGDLMDDTLFDEYLRVFYELDPFYLFTVDSFKPGLYRLDEVAPEHFRVTEYYKRYFSFNVAEDEVQFLLPCSSEGVLSLSLGSKARFTDVEFGSLCLYTPWVLPVMKIAAQLQVTVSGMAPDHTVNLPARLRQSGRPHLTEREAQTATLLLAGHSTKAISLRMAISPETVKVHRRNLYEKLGVSSQAEIFSLFMAKRFKI
jgi:DNA-binding CsgD family transcriptional regulator